MTAPAWTDDRIALLDKLWTEGLSASEIAARLTGVTRNAVLGKLHRLGRLGGRPNMAAKPRTADRRGGPRPRPSATPKPAAPRPGGAAVRVAPFPEEPGQIDRLQDLRAHSCRWPIGDPLAAGFSFCGRWVDDGPYCEAHRQVAYLPRAKRKARRRVAA